MRPNFRAWLKPEQRMVDVYEMTFMDDKITIISTDMNFYINDEFELMQSTGLKDKHGKEIYEGDIVRYIDGIKEITCPIKFIKEYACFGVEWRNGLLVSFEYLESTYTMLDDLEVVGNIYENPELLKGE